MNEIKILAKMNHPNIAKLICSFETETHFFIFEEYCKGETLVYKIERERIIDDKVAKKIFQQLMSAIKYIHSLNISHRDIKAENVIIQKNNIVKLIDFGFSFETTELITKHCGSLKYCPPECHARLPYRGEYADMWSCGILLYVMLTSQFPFRGENKRDLIQKIAEGQFFFDAKVAIEAKDLIKLLVVVSPKHRITAEDVLNHSWFGKKSLAKNSSCHKM